MKRTERTSARGRERRPTWRTRVFRRSKGDRWIEGERDRGRWPRECVRETEVAERKTKGLRGEKGEWSAQGRPDPGRRGRTWRGGDRQKPWWCYTRHSLYPIQCRLNSTGQFYGVGLEIRRSFEANQPRTKPPHPPSTPSVLSASPGDRLSPSASSPTSRLRRAVTFELPAWRPPA